MGFQCLREDGAKERVQDSFLRFLVEAAPGPLRAGRQSLGFRVRGMTEHYAHLRVGFALPGGGRASGEPAGSRRAASVWLSGRAEFRTYPDSTDRNYPARDGIARLECEGARRRPGRRRGQCAGLDYRRTRRFDRQAQAVTLDYRHCRAPENRSHARRRSSSGAATAGTRSIVRPGDGRFHEAPARQGTRGADRSAVHARMALRELRRVGSRSARTRLATR